MLLKDLLGNKIKVYAFVGPSGTGKSYRAQMVASEKNINYIIDDGLLIKDNEVIAGESAKKAPTKIETVKHACQSFFGSLCQFGHFLSCPPRVK